MQKKYRIIVNGRVYEVEVEELGASMAPNYPQASPAPAPVAAVPSQPVAAAPMSAPVAAAPAPSVQPSAPAPKPSPAAPTPPAGGTLISAPMPGKILKVFVQPGMQVKKGFNMLVLEAMKMENEILAPSDGVIKEVRVKEGDNVNTGDPMVLLG